MDDDADAWVPLAEAARLSGRHADTLRRQIRAGVLGARKDNAGRWEVRRADLDALPGRKAPPYEAMRPAARAPTRGAAYEDQALRGEVEFLRGELERARAAHRQDSDRLLDAGERRAAAEAARDELRRELADTKAERDKLLAMLEAALAERRAPEPPRRPWLGLRRWWRRFVEGEG